MVIRLLLVLAVVSLAGCSSPSPVDVGIDADQDAGRDAAVDVGIDAARDVGVDAPPDAWSYEDVIHLDAFDPTDAWWPSSHEATPVYTNPEPPDCSASLAPPRWEAPTPPAAPQTRKRGT